jgi:hypothetical protein
MSLYTPGRRANGTNARARYRNKWAVWNWKRKQRKLKILKAPQLAVETPK